jgi:hypothetical protein
LWGVTATDVSEASEFAAVLETVIDRDRFGGATAVSGVAAVSETAIDRDRFAGAGNGDSEGATSGAGCATAVSGIASFAAA